MPLQPLLPRQPNIPLVDVMGELRLKVVDKQRNNGEWIFHIARESFSSSPDLPLPPQGGSYPLYSGFEDEADVLIYEEEAAALRRRFAD